MASTDPVTRQSKYDHAIAHLHSAVTSLRNSTVRTPLEDAVLHLASGVESLAEARQRDAMVTLSMIVKLQESIDALSRD